MKKLIIKGAFLVASIALAVGGTTAFFGDTETSSGNVFAAGAIDLKVDNDSYYNGNHCVDVDETEDENWQWQGEAVFPVPDTPCTTSWNLDDLDKGHLFFDFRDLKPGDEGEDTISLHVQNDAWACMDLTLTSNDDVSSNEPELLVDEQDDPQDINDGELAQNINFVWWADDGDNVLEDNENILSDGIQNLYDLASQSGPFSVALADMENNVWGTPGPIPADKTVYIAKAWCFGEMELDPVLAGQGENPSVESGVLCNGENAGNETQTDTTTLDVQFRAIQARHNAEFICNPGDEVPLPGTLTVIKVVDGGELTFGDFSFSVNDTASTSFEDDGTNEMEVPAGNYTVIETAVTDYVTTYSNSVNGEPNCNNLPISEDGGATCTVTNTFAPACVAHSDVMLVLDRSGSINDTEEADMKNAAKAFVDALNPTADGTHIGLSSFATTGTLDEPLTSDGNTVKTDIDALITDGFTNLFEGIDLAHTELQTNDRTPDTDGDYPDIMVIITDGNPNQPPDEANARAVAAAEADAARANGVEIYVVGVGSDVDETYLIDEIADDVAHYFSAADFTQLQAILEGIANCENVDRPTGTLTITKIVNNNDEGTAGVGDFDLFAEGIGMTSGVSREVIAGTYTVTEDGPGGYTATFGEDCDINGEVTVGDGENKSCTITNNDNPRENISTDNFGTTTQNDIPNWDENGNTADSGADTQTRASGSGNDSASPDGDAFAVIGDGENMCQATNTAGYSSIKIKYYWRGDPDAEDGESGFVEYRSGGNCNSGGGWTSAINHELDDTNNNVDEGWSSLQTTNIPNGTSFIRFRNGSNDAAEEFRVDGVSLTGIPN